MNPQSWIFSSNFGGSLQTTKVDKTSPFPLASTEQRISFMRLAKLNPEQAKIDLANKTAVYYWRLGIYENTFNNQTKPHYHDAVLKRRILKKYGIENIKFAKI